MRRIEARWLGEQLTQFSADELSPVLEIGSSSHQFRTGLKPHIESFVHAPLRQRGVRIVTADLRAEEGVEIVGDVYDPAVQARLRSVGARTLLMCNLLEHLTDPQSFADTCRSFLVPSGRIVVTGPHDYPYHLDPIDTMFRPGVDDLLAMFPGTKLEVGAVLVDSGYWSDLRSSMSVGGSVLRILAEILRTITLRGGVNRARSRLSRLKYLFKPYKVAAVILMTPASEEHCAFQEGAASCRTAPPVLGIVH